MLMRESREGWGRGLADQLRVFMGLDRRKVIAIRVRGCDQWDSIPWVITKATCVRYMSHTHVTLVESSSASLVDARWRQAGPGGQTLPAWGPCTEGPAWPRGNFILDRSCVENIRQRITAGHWATERAYWSGQEPVHICIMTEHTLREHWVNSNRQSA